MAVTTDKPVAAAPALDYAQLAAAMGAVIDEKLTPLQNELASLKERLSKTEAASPRFVKMRPDDSRQPPGPRDALVGLQKNQERGGTRQIPVGVHGMPLHEWVKQQMIPAFEPGDQIRFNPEIVREGANRTWAEVAATAGADGYGQVTKRLHLKSDGVYRYQVVAKGLTPAWGIACDEYELLPA